MKVRKVAALVGTGALLLSGVGPASAATVPHPGAVSRSATAADPSPVPARPARSAPAPVPVPVPTTLRECVDVAVRTGQDRVPGCERFQGQLPRLRTKVAQDQAQAARGVPATPRFTG